MKNKLSLLLPVAMAFSLTAKTASATEWIHIFRDDTAKISESDPGPFDEYLDLDSLKEVEGWSLYTTKRILDDSPNQYYGKVDLATVGLSCTQFKMGSLYTAAFADTEQRTLIYENTNSIAQMERMAFNFFRGKLPIANTPALLYYHFACKGLDLRKGDVQGAAELDNKK
jgi:hypothetical protein